MLNRSQLLKMLIGLKEVNDIDLVSNSAVIHQIRPKENHEVVQQMASVVDVIYDGFDYSKSPEFLAKLQGKSEQVKSMYLRLLNAEKPSEARRRLGTALLSICGSGDAYQIVATDQHHLLDELKRLAHSIPE